MGLATTILRHVRRFARDRRGLAAVEFAAALPVLVVSFFACFELARYSLANLKIDRVAASAGDLISQLEPVCTSNLTDIFHSGNDVMDPFDLQANGRIIVSHVYRPGTAAATISWQRNTSGGLVRPSKIGTAGQTPTLPAGFTVAQNGGEVIVTEAYYSYTPTLAAWLIGTGELYKIHYYRPRGNTALNVLCTG